MITVVGMTVLVTINDANGIGGSGDGGGRGGVVQGRPRRKARGRMYGG